MKKLFLMLMMAASVWAQNSTPKPEDQLVTVPRRYVSAEGLTKSTEGSAISPYLGIGREIGEAVKGGLESVVDVSNRFADTPVGKFTLFMVAWKVIGQDLLAVVLGVPIYFIGMAVWMYVFHRMFLGVWVTTTDAAGKKVREKDPPLKFESRDARAFAGVFMFMAMIAWNVVMLQIIF